MKFVLRGNKYLQYSDAMCWLSSCIRDKSYTWSSEKKKSKTEGV